ncbi:hypothetical protein [Rhodopseudomonas palustris]|uniref:Uncharacterized protein n=1 Tax=Rhodopseudomonas palustris (strain BisB18) TaxID=316056 RepID=Q213H8_RHOPB
MDNNRRRTAWWQRIVRSFGWLTRSVAIVAAGTWSAAAQDAGYRSAATAPVAWQAFAKQLQSRFEQRLADADKDAITFQDGVTKRNAGPNVAPLTFVARAWVLPDGKVERLEFDGLDDKEIAVSLRQLLIRVNVGNPPADMLQPLRLRLSLRPKQPAGGK